MTGGPPSICFIVESGTDTRLVEGLARRARLTVLARAIPGGRAVSQPTGADVVVGPSGRAAFALRTFRELRRRGCGAVLVQGYGLAALAANLAARLDGDAVLDARVQSRRRSTTRRAAPRAIRSRGSR